MLVFVGFVGAFPTDFWSFKLNMKFFSPCKKLMVATAAIIVAHSAQAVVLYEDNFSGTAGSIVPTPTTGRFPNLVDYNNNRYQGSNNQPSIDGSGRFYSTNGGGAISLALPTLSSGDIIKITLDMVTSTTNASGYIIAGFTALPETFGTTNSGVLSAGLSGNGRLRVGSGTSNSNIYISSGANLNDSGVVLSGGTYTSALTTFVMTYNTGTGAISITFDNDNISPYTWNGSYLAALSDLKYFTIQFNGMAASNAAYVDYLKVEVIPEPSTFALLFGGLGSVMLVARKRRQAAC